MLCDAKVKYGSESAAASVFDVDEEEAAEVVVVGDRGGAGLPTAPDCEDEGACLGACWRRN